MIIDFVLKYSGLTSSFFELLNSMLTFSRSDNRSNLSSCLGIHDCVHHFSVIDLEYAASLFSGNRFLRIVEGAVEL